MPPPGGQLLPPLPPLLLLPLLVHSPSSLNAAPSSSASMAPDPSWSISSKHSLSCCFCSSESLGLIPCNNRAQARNQVRMEPRRPSQPQAPTNWAAVGPHRSAVVLTPDGKARCKGGGPGVATSEQMQPLAHAVQRFKSDGAR